MLKKLVILAILAIILGIGIFFIFEKKETTIKETSTEETYTDEYKAYLESEDYYCKYYQKYIWKESEREFGKKKYKYTEEKLQKINTLKEEGKALCDTGKLKEGEAKLIEAINIINFTMMN